MTNRLPSPNPNAQQRAEQRQAVLDGIDAFLASLGRRPVTKAADYERIIRILNKQLKLGGPSNFEQVCGHWMDEDLKALYLAVVDVAGES